ncbi:putative F-box/FBD/LRR-repeat protein At1g78760 [Medicago truncatula]|nr:putative F-box/FBD/LRR-repeat protein At1g78760 [Medicago truncatula]
MSYNHRAIPLLESQDSRKGLCLRNSSITLQALEFKRERGRLEPHLLKRIVNYAISHNVQRLGLWFYTVLAHIPPTMFSCHTLTHLKLSTYPNGGHETLFPKSFNLPALTSLQLESFGFCLGDNDRAEPFSTFNKLNSLIITNSTLSGAGTLCISSATLMNLTMYTRFRRLDSIELCTPSLCTFAFIGSPQKLSRSYVSSLKHVDIEINKVEPPLFLLNWLQELPDIKSLTVTSTTLQVLYLIPDLLKTDLPSLGNLKSLRVKMVKLSS